MQLGKLSQRERERRAQFAQAEARLREQLTAAFQGVGHDMTNLQAEIRALRDRSLLDRLKWLWLGR